jgi:hypothetical protein
VAPEVLIAGVGVEEETAQSSVLDPNDDDKLWQAFLEKGDRAIAMAVYDAGPIDDDIIDKVSAVVGAWQRLEDFLKDELSKDAESWG